MESSGGWQFWLEDDGFVRQFMVAEPDEIQLESVCEKNNLRGISCHEKLRQKTSFRFLRMKPGELCEWVTSIQSDVTPLGMPT